MTASKEASNEKAIWDGYATSAAALTTKIGVATFDEKVEEFRASLRSTEAIGPRVPGVSAEDVFFGKLTQHALVCLYLVSMNNMICSLSDLAVLQWNGLLSMMYTNLNPSVQEWMCPLVSYLDLSLKRNSWHQIL